MTLQDLLTEQIAAFHIAILDGCRRSGQPEQSDAMALRLRGNVMSMTKLQLAMIAMARAEATEPDVESAPEPPRAEAFDPDDHPLAGDALSRFVSRRLGPDENPHEAWQAALRESDDATQRFRGQASSRRSRDVNARPP